MPQKFQKVILTQLGGGLHKGTPANVVHKVNDANSSLPYDIAGRGNQPYTGPVKNAASGGLPSGTNGAGQSPVSPAGKPTPPFTK